MKKRSFKMALLFFMMLALCVGLAVPTMAATAKKPSKPILKSVTLASDTSISVQWNKSTNAKKYEVYVSVNGGAFKKQKTLSAIKFVHKNLKSGKTYAYKIKAINGKKKSAFSNVKKITVPAPVNKDFTIEDIAAYGWLIVAKYSKDEYGVDPQINAINKVSDKSVCITWTGDLLPEYSIIEITSEIPTYPYLIIVDGHDDQYIYGGGDTTFSRMEYVTDNGYVLGESLNLISIRKKVSELEKSNNWYFY